MDKKLTLGMRIKEQWYIYLFLIVMAVLIAFPIFWMVSISFRLNKDVFNFPPDMLPPTWTLEGYKAVLTSSKTMKFFLNSYIYGLVVTVIAIVLGIMAGYGLSRFEFKGKRIFSIFTISTQTIPAVTILIPLFIMFIQLKIYNTALGLIIAYISFALPYAIIMMLGYFNSISTELDEAARIDGASNFRTLWQIVTPVVVPGIISTMIYIFILSWNEYVFVLQLIKDEGLQTVPVGIAYLKGEASYEWNTMMAMSVLGSIPVLILYLFGQRKFISGLTAGAIKG